MSRAARSDDETVTKFEDNGKTQTVGEGGNWRDMLAARPEGVFLVRMEPDPNLNGWSGPTVIELRDPSSGKVVVVTPIDGDIGDHGLKLRG
jgi:hypothetical protein